MSMDAQLAEIYGTGQSANAEDDQVKLAAAELLVKLAGDNNVDLSQFSDEEVASMVQELQKEAELPPQFQKKEESGEEKKESKETPESKESGESSSESPEAKKAEAAEKVAEADFLGRVMAHSFAQECKEIEKDAAEKEHPKNWLRRLHENTKAQAGIEGGVYGLLGAGLGAVHGIRGGNSKAKIIAKAIGGGLAGGGVGAGVGAVGAKINKAMYHGIDKIRGSKGVDPKEYKAKHGEADQEALDALAEQRALAMAKEAGWVDQEGNLLAPPAAPEETKTASPRDLAVEQRALEMLEANGYPVKWAQ